MPAKEKTHVVVCGAGPAGLLAAHLLLNRSEKFHVTLVERGPNWATDAVAVKRSWMIGLATQGLGAMRRVPGLYERIQDVGVRGTGFVLHLGKRQIVDESSKDTAEGYFVDRNWIVLEQTKHLLEQYGTSKRLTTHFSTSLLAVDGAAKTVIAKDAKGSEHHIRYDLLLGCDGIRSAVRDCFIRKRDFQMELQEIQSRTKSVYVDMPPNLKTSCLHLVLNVDKGGFGGIWLPAKDESGAVSRLNIGMGYPDYKEDEVDPVLNSADAPALEAFFRKHLGHLSLNCTQLAEEWAKADFVKLGDLRINFYHLLAEKVLLLGDAAHATSPAIGQGMNTALDDARTLVDLMALYDDDLDMVLPAFSRVRVKDGNALTDISANTYSFSPSQQAMLTLETAWNGVMAKLTGTEREMMVAVGVGERLSYVHARSRGRLDRVRAVNTRVRRDYMEREMGLLPAQPARHSALTVAGCALAAPAALVAGKAGCLAGAAAALCGLAWRTPAVASRDPAARTAAAHGLKLPAPVRLLLQVPGVAKAMLTSAPPEHLPDVQDVFGESPYDFRERVPGQVWSVLYLYQCDPMMVRLTCGECQRAEVREQVLERCKDEEERGRLEEDLRRCDCAVKVTSRETRAGGLLKAGMKMENHMLVLRTSEGGLLLYSPVKIREEVKSWLEGLGRVDFIVSPSSGHTCFVKSAKEAFPGAKVVCSDIAALKMKKAGVATDINYTENVEALRTALEADFKVTAMDDMTRELVLLHKPSGTLCVCDLIYCSNLEGPLTPKDAQDPEKWMGRLFSKLHFWPQIGAGLLSVYRYQMLDPSGGMPTWPAVTRDSKHVLGQAILELLSRTDYTRVCSAHLEDTLDAALFRDLLRATWGWAAEEAAAWAPAASRGAGRAKAAADGEPQRQDVLLGA